MLIFAFVSIAMIKYEDRANLREKGHCDSQIKVQLIMAGKLRQRLLALHPLPRSRGQ